MHTFTVDNLDCRLLRDWSFHGARRQRPCCARTAAKHWAREYGQAIAVLANGDALVFRRDGERVRQQTIPVWDVKWQTKAIA